MSYEYAGSRELLLDSEEENGYAQEVRQRSLGAQLRRRTRNACSVKSLKRRVPIIEWLPKYSFVILLQDVIAGVAVGLTAIPQSIAYAIVAGLEPQYGLYSAFIGGFVYLFFGSCKDVTVGPTAILAVMVSKFVTGYGPDFAILAAFLSGCVCLLLGIFNLGFLVNFISNPVISGFTSAAALQIASTQIKGLFGLSGTSGTTFVEAVTHLVNNIKTIRLWDTVLGVATILALIVLKELARFGSRTDVPGYSTARNVFAKMVWFVCLARNAIVVIIGTAVAYYVKLYTNTEPFYLTGTIHGGLPKLTPPPFSTVVGNVTYSFTDMLSTFGPQSIVIPLISILETVAVAKAFSKGKMLDATQEMFALGMCNIIGSFMQSMPITGSFTRTAINYASGVQTQLGGIFKGLMVILALSLLTDTFYYIPKATLAGLIMMAMFSMVEFAIVPVLWRNKKSEFCVWLVTAAACLYFGLEYGIISGIVFDAFILLYKTSAPRLHAENVKMGDKHSIVISLGSNMPYCVADNLTRFIQKKAYAHEKLNQEPLLVVVNGQGVLSMDITVIKNLIAVTADLEKANHSIVFWNFPAPVRSMFENIAPHTRDKFSEAPSLQDLSFQSQQTIEEIRSA